MDLFIIIVLFSLVFMTGIMFLDRRNMFILSLLLLVNLLFWYLAVGRGMAFIYEENSWIENIQAGLLLGSAVIFASSAFSHEARARVLALLLALLCFIFSFREVDVDELDVPAWLIFLLAEEGRAIFFIMALGLLLLLLRHATYYLANRMRYLRSSLGIYFLLAAILLVVLSGAFEKDLFGSRYHVFYEELSELLAYCMLFAASLDLPRALRRIEMQAGPQEG